MAWDELVQLPGSDGMFRSYETKHIMYRVASPGTSPRGRQRCGLWGNFEVWGSKEGSMRGRTRIHSGEELYWDPVIPFLQGCPLCSGTHVTVVPLLTVPSQGRSDCAQSQPWLPPPPRLGPESCPLINFHDHERHWRADSTRHQPQQNAPFVPGPRATPSPVLDATTEALPELRPPCECRREAPRRP